MDLIAPDSAQNILPRDGTVHHHGVVFALGDAARYYEVLLGETPWKNDETFMFGKHIVTGRMIAWYADRLTSYAYSGTIKEAQPWTAVLLDIKEIVEERTASRYNSCLLNLYHHGGEGMGWHSDNETSLVPGASIASLSLGAERKFSFKHKRDKQTVSIILESGSLLEMKGETQKHWLHQVPKSSNVTEPRINLTFRSIRTGAGGMEVG